MSLNFGKMDFAVSFNPLTAFPLDARSYFESYDAAVKAAEGAVEAGSADGTLYFGQILTVVENGVASQYQIQPDKSLSPIGGAVEADDVTIVSDENDVIGLKDFGKRYYAYIPEVKDETSGEVTTPASYKLTEVDEDHPWLAGLEPRVVSEDNVMVIGWYEPNPTTIEGINNQVTGIQGTVEDLQGVTSDLQDDVSKVEESVTELENKIGDPANSELGTEASGLYALLDEKANKDDVYTIEDADKAIAAAVAGADHLKRKIVASVDEALATENAEQYIFMISTGLQYDDDKYDEYIVLDGKIEKVGAWEVDLSNYVTKDSLGTTLEDYVTETALSTTLEDYATSSSVADNYVAKEEGKSLVSDEEIAKLKSIDADAANFISSVSSDFTVADGELSLNNLNIEKVSGLQDALDNKVNKVVYTVPVLDENGDPVYEEDGVTPKTEEVEGTLLSPTDKDKLDALVITEDGVEISGTVNASNVEGLGDWLTSNRDKVNGLFSTEDEAKLDGIEAGAQVNVIDSVSDEFVINEGKVLTVNSISAEKITGLETSGPIVVVQEKVESLEEILNGTTNEAEEEVPGLVSVVDGLKTTIEGLNEVYVSKADFNATVGNLDELLAKNKAIVEEIEEIKGILQWQPLK